MLIVWLALRDLKRDKFFLFCNTAILVGALLPFLVLLGVKNGVYSALISELLEDPVSRQVDTVGNASFLPADIAPIKTWPDVAFVTPKVRSQFDFISVKKEGDRKIVTALAIPSGQGDPTLPEGARLEDGRFALSANLARRLGAQAGDPLLLVTQAEDRPRQLVLTGVTDSILDEGRSGGDAVYLTFETLDLIEAFYDAYSLPDHGITGQRDLASRQVVYEGVRLFAHRLEDVSAVQSRLENLLNTKTFSKSAQIATVLQLGRNLDVALSLIAACAGLGLCAAFGVGFWAHVMRKRGTLALVSLLGVPAGSLTVFPVVQAVVAAIIGTIVSFALFALIAPLAQHLFGAGLPGDNPVAMIGLGQGVMISVLVTMLVIVSTSVSAWAVQKLDPASVLRSEQ